MVHRAYICYIVLISALVAFSASTGNDNDVSIRGFTIRGKDRIGLQLHTDKRPFHGKVEVKASLIPEREAEGEETKSGDLLWRPEITVAPGPGRLRLSPWDIGVYKLPSLGILRGIYTGPEGKTFAPKFHVGLIFIVDGRPRGIPEAAWGIETENMATHRGKIADIPSQHEEFIFDILVLGIAQLNKLSQAQLKAVQQFVIAGYSLLIVDNTDADVSEERLRMFVPIDLREKNARLPANLLGAATEEPLPQEATDRVKMRRFETPKDSSATMPVYMSRYGAGKVCYTAFDCTEPALIGWDGMQDVWRTLGFVLWYPVIHKPPHSVIKENVREITGKKSNDAGHSGKYGIPNHLLLIGIIMLAGGLLNLVWVRRFRKGKWGYPRFLVTIWVLAVGMVAILVCIRLFGTNNNLRAKQFEIQLLYPEKQQALDISAFSVKAPTPVKRRITWEQPPDLISRYSVLTPFTYYHQYTKTKPLNLAIGPYHRQFFGSLSVQPHKEFLQGTLKLNKELQGTIALTNNTQNAINSAFIVWKNPFDESLRTISVPDLAPGEHISRTNVPATRPWRDVINQPERSAGEKKAFMLAENKFFSLSGFKKPRWQNACFIGLTSGCTERLKLESGDKYEGKQRMFLQRLPMRMPEEARLKAASMRKEETFDEYEDSQKKWPDSVLFKDSDASFSKYSDSSHTIGKEPRVVRMYSSNPHSGPLSTGTLIFERKGSQKRGGVSKLADTTSIDVDILNVQTDTWMSLREEAFKSPEELTKKQLRRRLRRYRQPTESKWSEIKIKFQDVERFILQPYGPIFLRFRHQVEGGHAEVKKIRLLAEREKAQ